MATDDVLNQFNDDKLSRRTVLKVGIATGMSLASMAAAGCIWPSVATSVAGNPMGYIGDDMPRVVYQGNDKQIHEIFLDNAWEYRNLSTQDKALDSVGDPMGYMDTINGMPRVVYRGTDNHIHELALYNNKGQTKWWHSDISTQDNAPSASGDPMGYIGNNIPRVVYTGHDSKIHELDLNGKWAHNALPMG